MKDAPIQPRPRKRGGIPKGETCAGCGGTSTGVHLDHELLPKNGGRSDVQSAAADAPPADGLHEHRVCNPDDAGVVARPPVSSEEPKP